MKVYHSIQDFPSEINTIITIGTFDGVHKGHKQVIKKLNNIAKTLLKKSRIEKIYDCGLCTYELNDLFFSYRRDGDTGRMASMIWID